MDIRLRIKWWLEDHDSRNDYVRWERALKKYRKIGCPKTMQDYRKIHDIFMKASRKCKDWNRWFDNAYPTNVIEECKSLSIFQVYERFYWRLDYCTDRMGYGRWMELCAYLYVLECKISTADEEKGVHTIYD